MLKTPMSKAALWRIHYGKANTGIDSKRIRKVSTETAPDDSDYNDVD